MSIVVVKKISGLLTLLVFSSSLFAMGTVHHDMDVLLKPDVGTIGVQDKLTLPNESDVFEFTLHSDLLIKPAADYDLQVVEKISAAVPVTRYRLRFRQQQQEVVLRYDGKLQQGLASASTDYSSNAVWTPAVIGEAGVFLAGVSAWYPQVADQALSFSMRVSLPPEWVAVSQGSQAAGKPNSWSELQPQEEIYLIAARYQVYERQAGNVRAQVYLRAADEALAQQYLAHTADYIEFYSRLLGEYPYSKFALVENFLQTGYGMPSFTLLGSRVIRLPFIPFTSYPHEILHNWWGNSVYVDYESGNWSEGLTTYLADHLLKQRQNAGAGYRRDALQRYADYVSAGKDITLRAFRARHSQASQAIGYSKAMMLFHMIRLSVGDDAFVAGLRRFYQQNRFQVAGYTELVNAFELASGASLQNWVEPWLERSGLPLLSVGKAEINKQQDDYQLILELQQQSADPFDLLIPVFIQTESSAEPERRLVRMNSLQQAYRFKTGSRPVRVAVDPQYDVPRKLHASEIPASLAQLFAADDVLIVLPSFAPQGLLHAYRELAKSWSGRGTGIELVKDEELEKLPQDRSVWVLGRNNRFAGKILPQLAEQGLMVRPAALKLGDMDYDMQNHSFAVATRLSPGDDSAGQTIGWLAAHSADAVAALARKLPHYGKYSYVLFAGQSSTNVLKGQWQPDDAALWVQLPGSENSPPMLLPREQALGATIGQ